jgi:DNA-directed RNA polymerase subunit RPC12/RpoP
VCMTGIYFSYICNICSTFEVLLQYWLPFLSVVPHLTWDWIVNIYFSYICNICSKSYFNILVAFPFSRSTLIMGLDCQHLASTDRQHPNPSRSNLHLCIYILHHGVLSLVFIRRTFGCLMCTSSSLRISFVDPASIRLKFRLGLSVRLDSRMSGHMCFEF